MSDTPRTVPDGCWEALQRLIEDAMLRGPASREDASAVNHLRGYINDILRELAEARAECERLREDAARINWLEANPRHAQIIIDGETKDCVFYGISTHDLMPLRAAIDAARRK
jgi:hypothetical protein